MRLAAIERIYLQDIHFYKIQRPVMNHQLRVEEPLVREALAARKTAWPGAITSPISDRRD
jgi:hypothetical protein